MADSNWLSYVGAITGAIGTITGIAGAVMGLASYRQLGKMKSLDLRLQLRTAVSDLYGNVQGLNSLLKKAKNSRTAIVAATGQAGAFQRWLEEYGNDLSEVRQLVAEAPDPSASFESLSHSELESKLVSVHQLQSKATMLNAKYRASLADDDMEREQIRADHRQVIQAAIRKDQL